MTNRRAFIVRTAALGALVLQGPLAACGASNMRRTSTPLRLLLIGGTGFVGSHCAQAAVDRGHKVAVLGRGKKQDLDLPQAVETLIGDRNRGSDLEPIADREWDAVIDLAAFAPQGVRTLGQALKDRVKHYTLISTVAVYERPNIGGTLTEKSALLAYKGADDPYSLSRPRDAYEYGALKVLCEVEAEQQFQGKAFILRPGYIAGPGESQGQFAYWSVRMEKGGEVLVAGDSSTPVQFIDVRDLADWCIRMVEHRATGIYNVTGPAARTTLSQFIAAAHAATASASTLTWVPPSWLAAQEDRELWSKLLYWSLEADQWGWAMQMNIDRALTAGLTLRPLNTTREDTVAWHKRQPAERQAGLLSTWKKKENGTGVDRETIAWPVYLKREKEILATWHAQRSASA